MIQYSFVYVSVFNGYLHLMPLPQKQRMCKRVDCAMTMVRGRDTGSAIEHRFIAVVLYHHRHRVIAPSTSHCRTIALLSSHHHAIVIAPSSLCSIDPISMVRWYDSEMCGSILLISVISFHYFFVIFQLLSNITQNDCYRRSSLAL